MQFIGFVIRKFDEHHFDPVSLCGKAAAVPGHLEDVVNLYFDILLDSTLVSQPEILCWSIQHNLIWGGGATSIQPSKTRSVVRFRLRRKLYDKIREMDRFPNFVGARVLGYCLNVLGFHFIDRHKFRLHAEDYPLQRVVIHWTKRNFRRLAEEYPNLLDASLQGFVSYDVERRRLVRVSGNKIKNSEDTTSFLDVD